VLKVESDLILVIFMGESRKWHTNDLIGCGQQWGKGCSDGGGSKNYRDTPIA